MPPPPLPREMAPEVRSTAITPGLPGLSPSAAAAGGARKSEGGVRRYLRSDTRSTASLRPPVRLQKDAISSSKYLAPVSIPDATRLSTTNSARSRNAATSSGVLPRSSATLSE